jgi:sporulation protein YlmC with PRC-barrel domain
LKIATFKKKGKSFSSGYDVIFDFANKKYSDFICARMHEKDIVDMRDKLEEILIDINKEKIKLIGEKDECPSNDPL